MLCLSRKEVIMLNSLEILLFRRADQKVGAKSMHGGIREYILNIALAENALGMIKCTDEFLMLNGKI